MHTEAIVPFAVPQIPPPSHGKLSLQPHPRPQLTRRRFRCKVGGEWKPLSSFSNKQQSLVRNQMDRGAPVSAANSGMTCRDHSGAPRTELRCELCSLIKPLDDFSKNSRKVGDNVCSPRPVAAVPSTHSVGRFASVAVLGMRLRSPR